MFIALLILLFLLICRWRPVLEHHSHARRHSHSTIKIRSRKKPQWVRTEIIRLQAHLPDFGCRKLADMFNRLFASRGVTVSVTSQTPIEQILQCFLFLHHKIRASL